MAGGDASASNWRNSSSVQGCPGTADNWKVERSDTGGPGSLSVKWAASGVMRITPVPSTWQPKDLVAWWAVKCPMSKKGAAQLSYVFLSHVFQVPMLSNLRSIGIAINLRVPCRHAVLSAELSEPEGIVNTFTSASDRHALPSTCSS